MSNSLSTTETIGNTVQKAKSAQFEFEKYNQAQVDEVVTAVAWSICNPTNNKLIADLADYKNINPSSKLSKLHFYPFGGIKKTTEWLNLVKNFPLIIGPNNEFKPKKD